MQQALLILQILVAVALIGLILIQHGKGADAGAAFGSGTSGSIFGARGPASFLAKITALLAAIFFFNSMALAYLAGATIDRSSVVERFEAPVQAPAEAPPADGQGNATGALSTTPADVPAPSDVPSAPQQAPAQQ